MLRKQQSSDDSGLLAQYTFKNFDAGILNQPALSTSLEVAKKPGAVFNPLFLCGPSGAGKTHLANAIGNSINKKRKLKVKRITGETFLNACVKAFRNNKVESFRKNYCAACDVLIVDDIHDLKRGEALQDEFCKTVSKFVESNRQVIITGQKSAHQMLKHRLGGALTMYESADVVLRS